MPPKIQIIFNEADIDARCSAGVQQIFERCSLKLVHSSNGKKCPRVFFNSGSTASCYFDPEFKAPQSSLNIFLPRERTDPSATERIRKEEPGYGYFRRML
jgi:hypothetical protein